MTNRLSGSVLTYLRRAVHLPNAPELNDGELLQRFTSLQDQAAFEALVQRHARVVWGACRRVTRDAQEAEDAFQATFLVLLHKAGALTGKSSLGSWLYGVGYRIALDASRRAARRQARERKAALMAETRSEDDGPWEDLRPILDAELSRLPEKYRAPLLLCYLEGKTNEQAARELGRPLGSLSMHLARGREMLRERLAQRGVALTLGALATVLAERAATASVPPQVIDLTVTTAYAILTTQTSTAAVASASVAALTEGMVKTMSLTKWKIAAALLISCVALTGSGVLAHHLLAAEEPAVEVAANQPPTPAKTADELSVAKFEKLQALIKPDPKVAFERIPWMTGLWEARKKAAAEDKPIVLWAGDPLPLGMT
jgi:RNA polymerase sigma factor (sigma-70 family)